MCNYNFIDQGISSGAVRHQMWVANQTNENPSGAVRHQIWVAAATNCSGEFYPVPYGTELCTPPSERNQYSIPTGLNPKPYSSLRDYERIALGTNIDEYYQREVKPHLPNSWMDRAKDKIGYEINFTKYFYKYKPLRSSEEIMKELMELERESEGLMREMFDENSAT